MKSQYDRANCSDIALKRSKSSTPGAEYTGRAPYLTGENLSGRVNLLKTEIPQNADSCPKISAYIRFTMEQIVNDSIEKQK